MTDDTLPPAEVAAQAAFVRRLAFHLLRDDADADDAAQETLARALERPPHPGPGARGWFATVLRNVLRKERRSAVRRDRRERVAARPEALASAANGVARAELLETVACAVRDLDPVSREVVLLRHFADLPPREIAAQLGVPVETVKSRLQRAHARLRERLDQDRGGNVEGWRSALAGLVGIGGLDGLGKTGAPVGGGIAVGTATKVGLGTAAAALIGGAAWLVASRPSDDSPALAPKPPAVVAKADPAPPPPLAGLAAKPRVPSDTQGAPRVPAPSDDLPAGWVRTGVGRLSVAVPGDWKEDASPPEGGVMWSVLDASGKPVAAFGVFPPDLGQRLFGQLPDPTRRTVTILGRSAVWSEGAAKGNVAAHVAFDSEDPETPTLSFVAMSAEDGWKAHAAVVERVLGLLRIASKAAAAPSPVNPTSEPSSSLVADLAGSVPSDRVAGRVLHGKEPVAGATVSLLGYSVPVNQPDATPEVIRSVSTGDDGSFALGAFDPGSYILRVEAPGLGVRRVAPLDVRAGAGPVPGRVVVFGDAEVRGRAFLRTGLPAAGRKVDLFAIGRSAWASIGVQVVADADGAFRFPHLTSGRYQVRVGVGDEGHPLDDRRDVAVDVAPAEVKPVDLGSDHPEPVLRGAIRHASGSPVTAPGAYVQVESKAPAAFLTIRLDGEGRFERRLPAASYVLTAACIGL